MIHCGIDNFRSNSLKTIWPNTPACGVKASRLQALWIRVFPIKLDGLWSQIPSIILLSSSVHSNLHQPLPHHLWIHTLSATREYAAFQWLLCLPLPAAAIPFKVIALLQVSGHLLSSPYTPARTFHIQPFLGPHCWPYSSGLPTRWPVYNPQIRLPIENRSRLVPPCEL